MWHSQVVTPHTQTCLAAALGPSEQRTLPACAQNLELCLFDRLQLSLSPST